MPASVLPRTKRSPRRAIGRATQLHGGGLLSEMPGDAFRAPLPAIGHDLQVLLRLGFTIEVRDMRDPVQA